MPAVAAIDIDVAIETAATTFAYCPDIDNAGTTLATFDNARSARLLFEKGSAARYRAAGATALHGCSHRIRRDVDTLADLAAIYQDLPPWSHTAQCVADLFDAPHD